MSFLSQGDASREIHRLSGLCVENNVINPELYDVYQVKRGLREPNGRGVLTGLTEISTVNGSKLVDGKAVPIPGALRYRGIDEKELVNGFTQDNRFGFEETVYLLLFGKLPEEAELKKFKKLLSYHRRLPGDFLEDVVLKSPNKDIMNAMASDVLALNAYDKHADDLSIPNVLRQSIKLIAVLPMIAAYSYLSYRHIYQRRGLYIHNPKPELSAAENILRILRQDKSFTPLEAKVLDIALVLHAEHGGGNNSSFTTHLISSTGTDTYSAIAAAVGSLKGPRHGGANIAVINMINDIKAHVKDIDKHSALDDYLVKILKGEANDRSGLVYGMGHAIYTKSDPRAKILKNMAKKLAESNDRIDDYMLCDYIERRTPELYAEVHGKEILMPANVDLYSGFVYSALDIDTDVATPLFATARLAGWTAHRLEEIVNAGKLMRPAYESVQERRDYVAIADRK